MENVLISDVRQHLAVLHKRRGLIALCAAVGVAAAATYNYTARPLYEAAVVILLETDTGQLGARPAVERRRGLEALNTQFQILRSRALAEEVVARLSLHQDPEFLAGPILSPWERFQRTVLGRGGQAEARAAEASPAVAWFRSRLIVEPLPQSNVVNIRFVGYDPGVVASALNTLAQLYIEQTVRRSDSVVGEAQGWLTDRLGEQKKAIGRGEQQLRDYEREQGLLNLDERQKLAEQKLTAMHSALTATTAERIAKENVYRQLAGMRPEQLEGSSPVLNSELVRDLRTQLAKQERESAKLAEALGPKHPQMQQLLADIEDSKRRLREESRAVLRTLEADYTLALKHEESLKSNIEPVQNELNELRQKMSEYGVLKREAEADQRVLKNLIDRSREAQLEGGMPVRAVRVLEKAEVPKAPVAPRHARNYQLGLVFGLLLGVGITLLLEMMDDSLKTPDDVKLFLKLPFLGMVPDASRGDNKGANTSPLAVGSARAPLSEAYRVIRTNLIFSSAAGKNRSVLVSSVNPAEGKTTTVSNIAASLAQNGAHVLVIDADLRRPRQHHNFNLGSVPGLTDVIVGNCTLEQALRRGVAKGLDVLPCGYVPPNPAELLGSAPMRELIPRLRDAYDWLILDAPPILTIADASVLSPIVDGVLLVIAAERTARHAVQRSIEQITGVGGTLLGVVLNRVNLTRNSYYFGRYYGDYYRSYYLDAASRVPDSAAPGAQRHRM